MSGVKGRSGVYTRTEEYRMKISKIAKSKGFGKWMIGKKQSKETIEKRCISIGKGKNHHAWKGGRFKAKGYVFIYKPDYASSNSDGYIFEHRFLMEQKIFRFLTKKEVVHHINGIRDDNRIENLQIMTASEHAIHHKTFLNLKKFKKGFAPWNKGTPCPQEVKDKISKSKSGQRNSPKTEFIKGNPPPKHKEHCICFRCKKLFNF